ncbi:MAG: DUF433 domain-containing protein [Bacteroidota bacterium]
MDWTQYIESKPEILYGKPIIKGTRIPVDLILEKLSLGEQMEDLLAAYPRMNTAKILACLSYAVHSIRNEEVYLV